MIEKLNLLKIKESITKSSRYPLKTVQVKFMFTSNCAEHYYLKPIHQVFASSAVGKIELAGLDFKNVTRLCGCVILLFAEASDMVLLNFVKQQRIGDGLFVVLQAFVINFQIVATGFLEESHAKRMKSGSEGNHAAFLMHAVQAVVIDHQ